jgi:hypothetical protein
MKKFTLVALGAAAALAANAQYSCNPSTSEVVNAGAKTVHYITLSDNGVADLQNGGATCTYVGPDSDNGRNLWYWNGLVAGDESYPRVDMEEGGYIAVTVTGDGGWSGAGVNIADDAPMDLSAITEDTHFHLAYMTSGTAPSSIGLIILDGAKIAIGSSFDDNGVIYPAVVPAPTDDWQGLDITLGQIKKLFPSFSMPTNLNSWSGNIFSWLGGAVAGTTFAFDAIYFYSTSEAGVESVVANADEANFVVTNKTLNVQGSNGVELYNLGGQLVKSTNGSVLGLESLQDGVYVAKSGNKVQKVVVR